MSAHTKDDLARTEKNCAFMRAVILDVNNEKSQADHYQDVFGGSASRRGLTVMASRLWCSPAMQAYAEELRAEVRGRFMVTVESLIAELQEIKLIALGAETPQCSAAVASVMGKAKLAGLDKAIEKEAADATPVRVIIQVEDASHRESK